MSFPRYPKYKHIGVEWLGEVPAHWGVAALKRWVDPSRPITYGIVQAGPHVEGGIPYVRPADMTNEAGIPNLDSVLRTSPEIAAAYRRSMLRAGDLVCSIGPSFGKVMVTPRELEGGNLTQGTARLAVDGANDPRFVFWALRSAEAVAQWESSVGGATFRALNLAPLAETTLPLPPADEQHAIAAFLDRETSRIDALVAEQERLIELLKEKRQAVISHAVTKGLDANAPTKDSGVEWLGEVPEHWEVRRFRTLLIEPLSYGANEAADSDNPAHPRFVRITDIDEEGSLRDDTFRSLPPDVAEPFLLREGDLLLARSGATVGKSFMYVPAWGQACFAGYLIRARVDTSRCLAGWIHLFCQSQSYWDYVLGNQIQTTIQNVSAERYAGLCITIPPLSEQHSILTALQNTRDASKALVAEAERAVELLRERRSAIISDAVTGQIDVRNAVPVEAA